MSSSAVHLSGRRRGGGGRGFTLIEILATMTLLAIVLPTAMNGISLCLATAEQARSRAEAAELAQAKLAELVAGQQWQHASLSGDFGADWPDYRWTAQVTGWEGTILQQVEVTVSWKHRGRECAVTLATLAYTGGANG